jgi:prepilin-type N-terminal cleavage/methylation domain-containing protein
MANRRRPQTVTPGRRSLSKAFTLIEILTVIAVIAILVGISVYAFRQLDPSPKVTRSQLENASSLLAEYEVATHSLKGLPSGLVDYVGDVTPDGGDGDSDGIANCWDANDTNFPLPGITRAAMVALLRVPANVQMFDRLGTKLKVELPHDETYRRAPFGAVLDKALVDGWSHPIYFVPADGIKVKLANGSTVTVRAPNGRPFFVSAGPDGAISARPGKNGTIGLNDTDDIPAGDDNIYSFQQ